MSFNRIPLPGLPGEGLDKGYDFIDKIFNSMRQNRLEPFQTDLLKNKIQSQLQTQQLNPLKLDLLKAQIANQKALANQKFNIQNQKETPEQKQQREIETARQKFEIQQNQKKSQQLEDAADSLLGYSESNEKISDLLDKNKNLTGNIQAAKNFLNLSGKDVGTFNNLSIPLQGKLAKELSQRGGAVVAGMASQGKYNLRKSHEYNEGIRESTTNEIKKTYKTLNDRYKRLTGKDLPQKLSPFYESFGNNVTVIKPNGEEILLPKEGAAQLIKDHPDHRIKG